MGQTNRPERELPSPGDAYARAPSIVREIGSIADMSSSHAFPGPVPREFWLRKAALVDRIALSEAETYAPEVAAPALRAARAAAEQLVLYDEQHGTRLGDFSPDELTSAGSMGDGLRAYVRQEYLVWNLTEDS